MKMYNELIEADRFGFVWRQRRYKLVQVLNRWSTNKYWWRKKGKIRRQYRKLLVLNQAGRECVVELYHDDIQRKWYLSRVYD